MGKLHCNYLSLISNNKLVCYRWMGFARGLAPCAVRAIPACAAMFATVDLTREYLVSHSSSSSLLTLPTLPSLHTPATHHHHTSARPVYSPIHLTTSSTTTHHVSSRGSSRVGRDQQEEEEPPEEAEYLN